MYCDIETAECFLSCIITPREHAASASFFLPKPVMPGRDRAACQTQTSTATTRTHVSLTHVQTQICGLLDSSVGGCRSCAEPVSCSSGSSWSSSNTVHNLKHTAEKREKLRMSERASTYATRAASVTDIHMQITRLGKHGLARPLKQPVGKSVSFACEILKLSFFFQ